MDLRNVAISPTVSILREGPLPLECVLCSILAWSFDSTATWSYADGLSLVSIGDLIGVNSPLVGEKD